MSNESTRQRNIYPCHEDYFKCITIRNPSSSSTLPLRVRCIHFILLIYFFTLHKLHFRIRAPCILHRRRHCCKLHAAIVRVVSKGINFRSTSWNRIYFFSFFFYVLCVCFVFLVCPVCRLFPSSRWLSFFMHEGVVFYAATRLVGKGRGNHQCAYRIPLQRDIYAFGFATSHKLWK